MSQLDEQEFFLEITSCLSGARGMILLLAGQISTHRPLWLLLTESRLWARCSAEPSSPSQGCPQHHRKSHWLISLATPPDYAWSYHGRSSKHTYLACQVEIRMVRQINRCGPTGLRSVVDHELPTIQGVRHPDLQLPGVAFFAIWTDPGKLDTIWQHLRRPEDLEKKCFHSCWVIPAPS